MTVTIGPPTPVEINQLAEEFEQVIDLYREVAPRRVLEIGTAAGGTLYHWLQNAVANAVVVSVDIDMSQIDQETADSWAGSGVECILVQGDSGAPWVRGLISPHAPFEWLFVDGCHEYDAAKADWNTYGPLMAPGSYVLLHDIALVRDYPQGRHAGVSELWRELQAAGFWTREIRAAPDLNEYGIGVLRLP